MAGTPALWDDRPVTPSGPRRRCAGGSTTPSRRPALLSMADDYARHALSQRASFEATHPAVMPAAGRLASEPVLRVADLGAADGVNSHGLIRDLVAQRAGRPLIYALVDLPTNAWRVTAAHLQDAFGPAADQGVIVVIPAPAESGPGVADTGTGAHYALPTARPAGERSIATRLPPRSSAASACRPPTGEVGKCCAANYFDLKNP